MAVQTFNLFFPTGTAARVPPCTFLPIVEIHEGMRPLGVGLEREWMENPEVSKRTKGAEAACGFLLGRGLGAESVGRRHRTGPCDLGSIWFLPNEATLGRWPHWDYKGLDF